MCTMCMQFHWKPEEGVGSPETGITYNCEVPCRCWDPVRLRSCESSECSSPLSISPAPDTSITYSSVLFFFWGGGVFGYCGGLFCCLFCLLGFLDLTWKKPNKAQRIWDLRAGETAQWWIFSLTGAKPSVGSWETHTHTKSLQEKYCKLI